MARFEQIRDRLPTLYRPDTSDSSLLTRILQAVGTALDDLSREATDVMQSHWFNFADRALYHPYFLRRRQLEDPPLPPPLSTDPALLEFPYIVDLARLAALLALPPWQEPPTHRELVEAYRLRLRRIVELYRGGLGTVKALRSMTEAQLPVDLTSVPEQLDRGLLVEEFAPLFRPSLAVQGRGEPLDMVGPLMRWTVTNTGLQPTVPTLYIQGVEPQEDVIDATAKPIIELYQHGSSFPRLGIVYRHTVAPGVTLRLRPAYASWLGVDNGLQRSEAVPTDSTAADPTAPGPWQAVPDAPTDPVVALLQTHDKTLWVATDAAGTGELWRFDGQTWVSTLSGLETVHCLAEDRQDLLIGTADGLRRMALYPEDGVFASAAVAGLAGQAVFAVFQDGNGQWWLGTAQGLAQFDPNDGDSVTPFVLHQAEGRPLEVYAITEDRTGTLYLGTSLGLFQYQPGTTHWYWYAGGERTEQARDWQQFRPDVEGDEANFPAANAVFLPPVRCVHRGADASLWLGTANGLARYVARSIRGLTYDTLLEAFPDLLTGPVFVIAEDARGLVWVGTQRGLLRYDHRDIWQAQAGVWEQLGRADRLYGGTPPPPGETVPPRGAWRFNRLTSQWQQFDVGSAKWVDFSGVLRTTAEPAVRAMAWTDAVVADLGQWDGRTFTSAEPVAVSDLVMHYKPSEQRIANGGIPAVPRLPVGSSIWRYLTLEPGVVVEPPDRPAWTIEGRQLPPPPALAAPGEGRYNITTPPPLSAFDAAVFAYHPAARLWFTWEPRHRLSVLVRLRRRQNGEHIDPAILDRVWQGMQQVRPAGVRAVLAVEEQIVRGGNNGNAG